MPGDAAPTRSRSDLADVVEMLLDKGVVVNADVAVSVGDTELLGVEVRAAIASFETAAKYGLEFPAGTDMERVDRAANGESSVEAGGDVSGDPDDADRNGGEPESSDDTTHPTQRPNTASTPGDDDDPD